MSRVQTEEVHDARAAAVVGFIIGFCIAGLLGLIAWDHPTFMGNPQNKDTWQWHMQGENAWYYWALACTLVGVLSSASAYALTRWK